MTGLKLLALTPFFVTGVLGTIDPIANPFMEYGALGICGLSVLLLFRQLSEIRTAHKAERDAIMVSLQKQAEEHKKEREALVEGLKILNDRFIAIIEKNIVANENLADTLRERPCLKPDSRIDRKA
jgi:hypothetical protein